MCQSCGRSGTPRTIETLLTWENRVTPTESGGACAALPDTQRRVAWLLCKQEVVGSSPIASTVKALVRGLLAGWPVRRIGRRAHYVPNWSGHGAVTDGVGGH